MILGVKEGTESTFLTDIDRFICNYKGDPDQALVIFICGIHGNEPMSIYAMQQVHAEIEASEIKINGSLIALAGNTRALKLGERFIDYDLNRVWTSANIKTIFSEDFLNNEKMEMSEIWGVLKDLLSSRSQENCVIFDLHTTSSPSVPFITINDTISNRKIAKEYPLATVFGIEEFLEGPLLSYMNELGFNAIGFEGGQHEAKEALENHKAFIWLSLANQGLIDSSIAQVKEAKKRLLRASADAYKFFEITFRHEVKQGDDFNMYPGFKNFQRIEKENKLAVNNQEEIISQWNNRIFMPLYQKKGDDGFFIIRRIPQFFLWLSKVLRSYNFEKILLLLPGVSIYDDKKHILAVNNKVASIMRNEVFHLFGFRQKLAHTPSTTLYIRREKQ
jgi:predicted deacylase